MEVGQRTDVFCQQLRVSIGLHLSVLIRQPRLAIKRIFLAL
jgi:hypothetical protein